MQIRLVATLYLFCGLGFLQGAGRKSHVESRKAAAKSSRKYLQDQQAKAASESSGVKIWGVIDTKKMKAPPITAPVPTMKSSTDLGKIPDPDKLYNLKPVNDKIGLPAGTDALGKNDKAHKDNATKEPATEEASKPKCIIDQERQGSGKRVGC